jgi:hypothetical protein
MNDAEQLRQEADDDDHKAEELAEENPSYADYLSRRADWRRKLAGDAELDT